MFTSRSIFHTLRAQRTFTRLTYSVGFDQTAVFFCFFFYIVLYHTTRIFFRLLIDSIYLKYLCGLSNVKKKSPAKLFVIGGFFFCFVTKLYALHEYLKNGLGMFVYVRFHYGCFFFFNLNLNTGKIVLPVKITYGGLCVRNK